MNLTPEQTSKIKILADINQRIETLKTDAQEIESWLRESLGVGEHDVDDGQRVAIKRQLQFDQAKAKKIIPPSIIALCKSDNIDPKKARKILPVETIALCLKEVGKPTVKIVEVDDDE